MGIRKVAGEHLVGTAPTRRPDDGGSKVRRSGRRCRCYRDIRGEYPVGNTMIRSLPKGLHGAFGGGLWIMNVDGMVVLVGILDMELSS